MRVLIFLALLMASTVSQAASVPDKPVQVTELTLDKEAAGVELVIIDFYADWCIYCVKMAPVLNGFIKKYPGRVKVLKFNVDEYDTDLTGYSVHGYPYIVIRKNGQDVFSGNLTIPKLKALVKQNLETFAP